MDGLRAFFFDNFAVIFVVVGLAAALFVAWFLGLFKGKGDDKG